MSVALGLDLFLTGCVASSGSVQSFDVAEPRVNRGSVVADSQGGETLKAAVVSDLSKLEVGSTAPEFVPAGFSKPDPLGGGRADVSDRFAENSPDGEPSSRTVGGSAPGQGDATSAPVRHPMPEGSGQTLMLPSMNETEMGELVEALRMELETTKSYRVVDSGDLSPLPPLPDGVSKSITLIRGEAGAVQWLRIGVRTFRSQPARLWTQGVQRAGADAEWEPASDLAVLPGLTEVILKATAQMKEKLVKSQLTYQLYQLSYIDVEGAIAALNALGIRAEQDPAKITFPIEFDQLPIVVLMPSPSEKQMGLLGDSKLDKGAFDLSVTLSAAAVLPSDANTAPASQLLVYYHPAHPEQFGRIEKLMEEFVDRPARQIFVEGMVLEISEDGLADLGLQWQFREGNFDTSGGALNAASATESLQLTFDDLKDFDKNWVLRLKALVRDGKAEILSRPSVLTLNNRQATIRVGTDIPIATSQEQGLVKDVSRIAFAFKYLATGISLNVLPRVSRTGDEVSMLVDTIVSAAVPNADLELRSASGEVLAAAPTVSTRRIQTYARIENNMPFIIGGLISKEQQVIRSKVPLLGDIPYLGVFFRSKSSKSAKREVIVVLTPHVLSESNRSSLGRYLPKDEDRFDEFGNELFRDTYRIRGEDVFDLTFLYENPRLQHFQIVADEAIERDFALAKKAPFSDFAEGRVPGDEILVYRMIYEVMKRLSDGEKGAWLDRRVNLDRLIVFESEKVGGYGVDFLEEMLTRLGQGEGSDSFFENKPNQALTITFRGARSGPDDGSVQITPVPSVEMRACPSRKAWGEMLWELNQPDLDGVPRFTILIRDQEDLVRLRRAVLLKKVVGLNGGDEMMTLANFSLGKILLIPEPKPNQTYPIDATVARYFYYTEHYYGASLQEMEQSFRAIEEMTE